MKTLRWSATIHDDQTTTNRGDVVNTTHSTYNDSRDPDSSGLVKAARWCATNRHYLQYAFATLLLTLLSGFSNYWFDALPITSGNLLDNPNIYLTWTVILGFPATGIAAIVFFIIGVRGQNEETRALRTENRDLNKENKRLETAIREKEEIIRAETENGYQLTEELYETQKEKITLWLNIVSQELDLGYDDRISVYYLDKQESQITLLSRYSKNPRLREQGRKSFDKSCGVIGRAWERGSWNELNIPCPVKEQENYYAYLEQNYNMGKEVAENLSMASRSLVGRAIEDDQGHHIGIIVLESLIPNNLNPDHIDSTLLSDDKKTKLRRFIWDASMRDMGPSRHRMVATEEDGAL